jgi:hypothetical protein
MHKDTWVDITEEDLEKAQLVWNKIAAFIGVNDICEFGDDSKLDGVTVGEMKLLMRYVMALSSKIDKLKTALDEKDKVDTTSDNIPKKEPKVALDEDGYTQTERIAFKDYCDSMRDCHECPANSYSGPCIEYFVHNKYANYIRKHRELFDRYCIGTNCVGCQYENANECFAAFLQDMKGNTI